MARTDPQINIRLPMELKERIEQAAVENNRSFKAELQWRLENWEEAIDQLDLTQQGWEYDRVKLASQDETMTRLYREIGDLRSVIEEVAEERRRESEPRFRFDDLMAHWMRLPADQRPKLDPAISQVLTSLEALTSMLPIKDEGEE